MKGLTNYFLESLIVNDIRINKTLVYGPVNRSDHMPYPIATRTCRSLSRRTEWEEGMAPAAALGRMGLRLPRLRGLSLTAQFALTGGCIMLVAMALAGHFVSGTVSRATVARTAADTAVFLQSLLAPVVQELAVEDALEVRSIEVLDRMLGTDAFAARFPYLEIWKADGLVAYSTSPELIGRMFPPPEGVDDAMGGEVAAYYTDLRAGEHAVRNLDVPFLEIYVPIRENLSGRVIAVAEIHEVTAPLDRELARARARSWMAVSGATLLVMAGLFWTVYRGSRTIERQKRELQEHVVEVRQVSERNRELGEKVRRASGRLAELNEKYLRQVGAELHDGPAQLVGFAALKIDHARHARTAAARERAFQAIREALSDALRDIRMISKGLMLPEVEDLPAAEIVARAAARHEERTGTAVALDCSCDGRSLPDAVKICAYRFVQEALQNAFRHADGVAQSVTCSMKGAALEVSVSDGGQDRGGSDIVPGLGLRGMRERVESLGGSMQIERAETGTKVTMRVLLTEGGNNG